MSDRPERLVPLPRDLELDRLLSIEQVSELSTLSPATIRRNYRDKLIRLSPKRVGMRLRDALLLFNEET